MVLVPNAINTECGVGYGLVWVQGLRIRVGGLGSKFWGEVLGLRIQDSGCMGLGLGD